MTKKRKNKLIPLFVLLAVFAVILFAYLALSDANDRREAEEAAAQDTLIPLAELDASTVTELRYKNRDLSDEWLTFTKSGDKWQAADPRFPLNTDRVAAMASAISNIAANRSVDGGSAAEFGLDEPAVQIEVTYNGSTTYRYAIGDKNTFNGEYYFRNDDGQIYMIAAGLLPYFQYAMEDLILLDSPVSDIQTEYIRAITVTLPTGEERVFTTAEDIAAVYDLFCEFDCTRYADYYADDAEMAEYGITKTAGIRIDYKRRWRARRRPPTASPRRERPSWTRPTRFISAHRRRMERRITTRRRNRRLCTPSSRRSRRPYGSSLRPRWRKRSRRRSFLPEKCRSRSDRIERKDTGRMYKPIHLSVPFL